MQTCGNRKTGLWSARRPGDAEDLIVATSDQLWRGVRNDALELALIDRIAGGLGVDRWDVFSLLDDLFERLATDGDKRLAQQA